MADEKQIITSLQNCIQEDEALIEAATARIERCRSALFSMQGPLQKPRPTDTKKYVARRDRKEGTQKAQVFEILKKSQRACLLKDVFILVNAVPTLKFSLQNVQNVLLRLCKEDLLVRFNSFEHSKHYFFALKEWMDGDQPKPEFAIKI